MGILCAILLNFWGVPTHSVRSSHDISSFSPRKPSEKKRNREEKGTHDWDGVLSVCWEAWFQVNTFEPRGHTEHKQSLLQVPGGNKGEKRNSYGGVRCFKMILWKLLLITRVKGMTKGLRAKALLMTRPMDERDEETYSAELWKDHLWGYLFHQKFWWVVLEKVAMS